MQLDANTEVIVNWGPGLGTFGSFFAPVQGFHFVTNNVFQASRAQSRYAGETVSIFAIEVTHAL